MRSHVHSTTFLALLLMGATAHATGLHPAGSVNGYECKMLNLTEQQVLAQSTRVPVRSGPSASAPVIGIAPNQIAVKAPATPINGYLEAINASGRTVWIAADAVTDYHSQANPSATCRPVILSNGRIGFAFPHS